MILAHKVALDPHDGQKTYFRKAAGTARLAYNWGLDQWQQQYHAGQADPTLSNLSDPALRRQVNAIKAEQFPWMLAVTKNATLSSQQCNNSLGLMLMSRDSPRLGFPRTPTESDSIHCLGQFVDDEVVEANSFLFGP